MYARLPLLGLALIASLSAPAHAASVEDGLRAFAQTQIKTPSPGREIHLYHWTSQAAVGTHGATLLDQVKAHLGDVRDHSYRTGQGQGAAGPGIYAAPDPMVTAAKYGMGVTNQWVLVQFVLRPGVKYLEGGHSFPEALRKQIWEAGCAFRFKGKWLNGPSNLTDIFWLSGGNTDEAKTCRGFRDQVVAATGIQALRYQFEDGSVDVATCKNRPRMAFVMIGDDAIGWDRIVAFAPTLPTVTDGHEENRLIISNLFEMAGQSSLPWPSLAGQKPATIEMATWIKTGLLGCGEYAEDPENQ